MSIKADAKGFTLIELLIVVSIIAILAAIAIPQFMLYKKRGWAATLNEDAKNAYTIAEAYLMENPGSILNSCTPIINAGYQPSAGVSCTASAFSEVAGSIAVEGDFGWGLTSNSAVINYNGRITSAVP